jgi:hypothetical protein
MSTNDPIHSLRTECYACPNPPTRAYRRTNLPTMFTCEFHGKSFEEILVQYKISFNKIALVMPVRNLKELRREFLAI